MDEDFFDALDDYNRAVRARDDYPGGAGTYSWRYLTDTVNDGRARVVVAFRDAVVAIVKELAGEKQDG